ncbi:PIN domain-containing protein [Candidatus Daviesbacteria bacterium]|nr:PIN domain-containing protein [Candidatus Daviesbacteria bacterium]
MTFIDTNIFLRFLLKDIESQYKEAKKLFLKAADGDVKLLSSTIVFFELRWVLGSYYRLSKDKVISILYEILLLKVEFNEREVLAKSLDLYKSNELDLEDCYNLIFAKVKKVKTFKTFDIKLAKQFNQIKTLE